MTNIITVFLGILSAAGPRPSAATLALRQEWGQLPQDVSMYDGLLALDDCSLIGHDATMYADDEVFNMLVYDCASDDGTQYFSNGNDLETPWLLAADADWTFWKAHPGTVTSLVRIEVNE